MPKRIRAALAPYPSLFLEALSYHEAGHAVMAVLLGVPIEWIAIGPRCVNEDDRFNRKVHHRTPHYRRTTLWPVLAGEAGAGVAGLNPAHPALALR
jgi:hypothetical protein